jgi:hypothetical protein
VIIHNAAESVTVALLAAVILMAINGWDPYTGKLRRFSLQFVMVGMTIFALLLGLLVCLAQK